MSFSNLLKISSLALLWIIIWKCVGNPISSDSSISYTPLNVADVRQIIYQADSSTILFSIVGKTKRSDGRDVFIGEWKYGTRNPYTDHYLVKDGYFMATELDTTPYPNIDVTVNPFVEQRLAKSLPSDGETWKHTLGDSNGDFWKSRSIEQLSTFCGTFDNVFGFMLFEDQASSILTAFYAKQVGWIGTSTSLSKEPLDFSCSYIRVNGKVFGHLWPEKDPTIFPPPTIAADRQKILEAIIAHSRLLIDRRFQVNGEM